MGTRWGILTRDLNSGPVSHNFMPLKFSISQQKKKEEAENLRKNRIQRISNVKMLLDYGPITFEMRDRACQEIILRLYYIGWMMQHQSSTRDSIWSSKIPFCIFKIQLRVFRKAHFVVSFNPVFIWFTLPHNTSKLAITTGWIGNIIFISNSF